ncbi:hypothetical protein [Streptomyces sp. NPDC002763]|uniref:hypothetical protein n=1 Tax=Streptomyces sp. NPDC002763 TaxID=3154427 RepID=UPI00331FB61D
MTAIDLVHGLWADGSCWSETVTEFHARSHESVAAQLPLESRADDIAARRQALSTRWLVSGASHRRSLMIMDRGGASAWRPANRMVPRIRHPTPHPAAPSTDGRIRV